ncbi:MAG: tetratricopeptide repeat protein [Candidatus Competibacter sp.]|nr:tetratricopeptide repeat protein [Candidatus Competibacter sp.]MDG4605951.1 FecR domain-containing protein [Candidatus Contendobacter sp.]HRD50387.1 FecR domain-containing protein [Candidatus Contendobacter sp.]
MTFQRLALSPTWLLRFCLLFLIALLPIGSARAQQAGEVVSVQGTADVLRDGRWQPIQSGESLITGDVVRTGAGSRVAIQLISGTQIKLNAHTQLEFKQIAPPSEGFAPTTTQVLKSILRVLSGEIWVRNSGEPLEIQTVPATATIRGTEFNLAVGPGGSAQLTVLTGLVEFGNPHGSVLVAANEQANVTVGAAPRKSVLLNPLDAVQWSFYYPGAVGDPADRDPTRRVDPQSPRYWTRTAQRHLQQGQVVEAQQALDRALALDPNDALAYGLRSNIALVQNRTALARAEAERAVVADPFSPSAYLSLSLVKQAEFDLPGALAAARQAVKFDPDHAQALIQESSLLFGMGRIKDAARLAEQARQKAPNDAMVNTVWGFLQLARNRVSLAREAFQNAIAQDSTLGLPHLGLGLALFRENDTRAAVDEMRKATLLEPQVSLYNSYLGKAFYEVKQDRRAQRYLEKAKRLDPRDPTPWLYDAIRLQSVNRPVEAVENLQKSIELNDDRAVYRSRLLLDEDWAARAATLGHIYNQVGFQQLGLQEGWKSVSRDPANYSAHRLLADSYSALPGIESARVSELLQSQLLQPINITPIQPQLAETKLLIPSAGPMTPSLYEFNPLLVRNQPTLFFSGVGGNENTWGDDLIVSGLTDRFSYSIGQSRYQSNGYRVNNDLENNIYNLFIQTAVMPGFNLQAEYRHRETTSGDLRSNFDGSFRSSQRRNIDQDTARIGARYSLSPQTDVIASVIYTDRDSVLSFPNININLGLRSKGTQAEAQLLYKAEKFNMITGLGAYSLDIISNNNNQQTSTTGNQQIAYSYSNIKIPDNVIWTVGLSYESDEDLSANLNEFNPKFGVQWAINDYVSLRAAAFKSVKRAFAFEQTIEPTQVAGFNQLTDYVNMTVSKNYGVGLDIRFSDQLFGGLGALRRDTDIPLGTLGAPEFYEISNNQENFYSAYLYWFPNQSWAISTSWLYEKFENYCTRCQLFYSTPAQLKTLSLPLNFQYFHPSGFFAGLGIVYVNQDIQTLDPRSLTLLPMQNEDFTLINAGLGYRFPKRWGIIALQANNLLDKQFHFQDYGFQTGDGTANPLYIPERTVLARLVLNF